MLLKVADTTFLEEYTFMLLINMGTGDRGQSSRAGGRKPENLIALDEKYVNSFIDMQKLIINI